MEDMLNAWDLRSLIWKREITDAETYTRASICHSGIIIEDVLNPWDPRRFIWKKR